MIECRSPWAPWVIVIVLFPSCEGRQKSTTTKPSPSIIAFSESSAPPVDHLAPGELQAGSDLAFGFPIPSTMKTERTFPNAIHLVGPVEVQGLVRYVQKNAQTRGLELKGNSMVFESVRIAAAGPSRFFRFEISSEGRTTFLLIKDDTPASMPMEPGLSDEERWRRAGMKPNGEPLDVSQLR